MERDEMLDELRRRMAPESFAAVERELARHGAGGSDAIWLERLLASAARLPLPEPPPALRQELRDLFDPPLQSDINAVLVFDSRAADPLVGVRSVASDDVGWSLVFTSEAADVALDVWPGDGGRFAVDGQVMAHAGESQGWRARVAGEHASEVFDADALGRFRCEDLRSGRYGLVVESTRDRIELGFELP